MSAPGRILCASLARIARSCRLRRFRTTAPLSPRRVRIPTRVTATPLGNAPTERSAPRYHRPCRLTARNAVVRLSDWSVVLRRRRDSVGQGRLGGDELPTSFPSTSTQHVAAAARAHAHEKPVRPRSLPV